MAEDNVFHVPTAVGRTLDGELVDFHDPAAAFLAYAKGSTVALAEAQREGLVEFFAEPQAQDVELADEPPPEAGKQAPRPADKRAPRAADK